ncbi:type-F conjugative transfer system protein TraW [Klebsiella variicola]|uniref:type-F conjugative transfer system protein TraW n=1 Tax=Klebsiella variicola TaxID=244366 RepID=UPI000E2DD255|nr:type-F conjugative transfer system protein TraW [Klebsiella variicola]SXF79835.1 conjugal transfer pilus assembly protein TraW [Klebsiella variicola]
MRDCLIAVFLLAGLSPLSQAKDLGTWGDTWPVAEQSFLALIQTRLATMMNDGTLSALQHQFAQRVEAHALRPVPVAGLKADSREHVSWHDPTFIAEQDIADTQHHIFVHQGDRINPLDTFSLNLTLYFIDGDDKRQIAWMKVQKPSTPHYKIILVNGNVREASDSLASRVYFDQQGVISRRLQLTYIPARVVQDGRRLKITSAALPHE